ncbi:MAG: glycosyltransferase family 61 protein [Pseudomonadota bacterium]
MKKEHKYGLTTQASDPLSWGYPTPSGFGASAPQMIEVLDYYKQEPTHFAGTFPRSTIRFGHKLAIEITPTETRADMHYGVVAVLACPTANSQNYFHWMVDCVARMALLGDLAQYDLFVMPHISDSYGRETLAMLGIPNEKILVVEGGAVLSAELLVAPTERRWGNHQVARWAAEFLRNTFSGLPLAAPANERIYISRKKRALRTFENEDEVEELLQEYRFQTVFLEDISVRDQIRLMQSSSFVLAPHGAGLTNIVFCRPKTRVIEIFSSAYLSGFFYQIAMHVRCRYRFLVFDPSQDDDRNDNSKNIKLNIAALRREINKML